MVPTFLPKEGAASFVQNASTDPFTTEWYKEMTDNAELNKDLESHFSLKDPHYQDPPKLEDFVEICGTFYKKHRVCIAMLSPFPPPPPICMNL